MPRDIAIKEIDAPELPQGAAIPPYAWRPMEGMGQTEEPDHIVSEFESIHTWLHIIGLIGLVILLLRE